MSQEHNCEKELLEKVNSEVTKQRLSDEEVEKSEARCLSSLSYGGSLT